MSYAELHCLSNFSFLQAASHPEELVERSSALGYSAIAITDRNSVAGVVRAHTVAKETGQKLIIGAEITPALGAVAPSTIGIDMIGQPFQTVEDGRLVFCISGLRQGEYGH